MHPAREPRGRTTRNRVAQRHVNVARVEGRRQPLTCEPPREALLPGPPKVRDVPQRDLQDRCDAGTEAVAVKNAVRRLINRLHEARDPTAIPPVQLSQLAPRPMGHHTRTTSHKRGRVKRTDAGCDPTQVFQVIRRRRGAPREKLRREMPEHSAPLPTPRQKELPAADNEPIWGAVAGSRTCLSERAEGPWSELDRRDVHHLVMKIVELPPDIHRPRAYPKWGISLVVWPCEH